MGELARNFATEKPIFLALLPTLIVPHVSNNNGGSSDKSFASQYLLLLARVIRISDQNIFPITLTFISVFSTRNTQDPANLFGLNHKTHKLRGREGRINRGREKPGRQGRIPKVRRLPTGNTEGNPLLPQASNKGPCVWSGAESVEVGKN